YAQSSLYPSSLSNLNQTSLSTDNVFSDTRAATQLPSISGSVAAGYAATLEVGLAVAATTTAASTPDLNQHGLTGMWYEPASSGQGLALEVYPDLNGTGNGL